MFQRLHDLIKQALLRSIPPSTPQPFYLETKADPIAVEQKSNVKPTAKGHRLTLWLLGLRKSRAKVANHALLLEYAQTKEQDVATGPRVVVPNYMSKECITACDAGTSAMWKLL